MATYFGNEYTNIGTEPDPVWELMAGTIAIANGSVTSEKISEGAVTSDKISTTDAYFNVQSDGKVGIGTASPSKGIEIVNKQGILVRELQGQIGNQMPIISTSITDRLDQTDWGVALKAVVENMSNGYGIAFWTRNAYNGTFDEKVRIDENGNVGIGTTNPGEKLHIEGSSPSIKIKATNEAGLAEIKLQSDDGENNADLWSIRASNNQPEDSHLLEFMSYSTASFVSALAIDSSGKVGILNTNPQYPLDITGDVNITGNYKVNGANLTTTIPAGTVSAFAGSSAPTGYLLCDGSEYSEATYANLFAVISNTYNTGGETANHFRVPDLRGRVIAGQDDMGGSFANRLTGQTGGVDGTDLGNVGGQEEHTLTSDQMQHNHGLQIQNLAGGSGTVNIYDNSLGINQNTATAHNNVQPTIILNYIIKI